MTKKTLSQEEAKKIGTLANLHVSSEEIERFTPQLIETLSSVEVLNTLSTEKTEGTFQVNGLFNIFREDNVSPSFSQEEALSNAKNRHNGFFVVPYVFQDEETA